MSESGDQYIYNILMNNRSSALLSVAVDLKLFDFINEEQIVTAHDISKRFKFSLRGADAVLVGLSCLDLLDQVVLNDVNDPNDWYNQKYQLNQMSREYLTINSPLYLGYLISMDSKFFLTPERLLSSLLSDSPNVYGAIDPWEQQEDSAIDADRFTLAMRSISSLPAKALCELEIFKTRKVILDVGAGAGIHLAQLLKSHDSLFGILFDLPNVFSTTRPWLLEQGIESRTDLISGDMFTDPWPNVNSKNIGVDTIFLSQILHDWDLSTGLELLKKAYDTLPDGGLLLVHEKLLNTNRKSPLATAMVSLDMLFWTKGQQYTREKLKSIMEKSGFQDFFSIPTIGYWSLTGSFKKSLSSH